MAVYHPSLQCMVERVEYDFNTQTGYLLMEDGNACDMAACIAMFEALDPGVRAVSTLAGNQPDTIYRRRADGWHAALRD